jgi:hypothetical protein
MSTLSPTAQAALASAICTRGPNKGKLLRSAPKSNTHACAAWHGAMVLVNPYKASIFALIMMDDVQRAIFTEVRAHFEAMPKADRIAFDKDRACLEACGVW